MKIVHVVSEALPYVKTGGLGEVVTPLATALAARGHQVSIVMPFYRSMKDKVPREAHRRTISVPMPFGSTHADVWLVRSEVGNLDFYLVDYPDYFDRPELYTTAEGQDYPDNSERFAFFCRAALVVCEECELDPSVIHAHDWQTALVPVYARQDEDFAPVALALTLHNLAFQGNFNFRHWPLTLLDDRWRGINGLEFYGLYSHLKGGVLFADVINTVSPTYAKEILTPDLGFGFDGLLRTRADRLLGIVNGLDTELWDPERDPYLPMKYSHQNWQAGKQAAKEALTREANLESGHERPLIGMVGRLTMQKGFDLFCSTVEELVHREANVIILATHGSPELESPLWNLVQRFPMRAAVYFGFNEPLSHRIYAAADMIAVPSRFEPCGLTQLIAMRYGAVPVVRSVGGLHDTVTDTTPTSLAQGTANGFVFQNASAGALNVALQRALYALEKSEVWSRLVQKGMRTDFSWTKAASEYERMYQVGLDSRKR